MGRRRPAIGAAWAPALETLPQQSPSTLPPYLVSSELAGCAAREEDCQYRRPGLDLLRWLLAVAAGEWQRQHCRRGTSGPRQTVGDRDESSAVPGGCCPVLYVCALRQRTWSRRGRWCTCIPFRQRCMYHISDDWHHTAVSHLLEPQ